MPAGPLAILPLPGNRSSIVWSERTARAAEIAAMDDAAYLEALRPAFGDFLGEISLAGARHAYPLSLSIAERFVDTRLALVGDAAHGVHPIAGQGLNLGLPRRGRACRGADFRAAAGRGHRTRRRAGALPVLAALRHAAMAVATDAFNRLFSNDNPALRALRDVGMGVVQAVPGLRRRFIREAAGLTGDVPRLLRGRAL
jgi:2-octaprenyl-6-methoxyphenol hydroxylase